MPQTSVPLVTLLLAAALAGVVAASSACSDPTSLQASDSTQTSQISLYALTGTPTGYPSALSIPANQAVSIDGTLLFDIAFDIDAQQRAVLYPMALIAWPRLAIHQVGMIKSTEPFEDVTRAPATGYNYDDTQIVVVGDVIIVESNDTRVCGFPFPPRMFAKFVVDAIDLNSRVLRIRITQNPNCGFRSFLAGIPED